MTTHEGDGKSSGDAVDPALDPEALRARSTARSASRRLRPEANDQYIEIAGTHRALPRARSVGRGRRRSSRRAATSAAPGTGTATPARSATPSPMVYLPLLEETGHRPSEKYAHAPEILAQCQRIGTHYGLLRPARCSTPRSSLRWDEPRPLAHRTDRGDRLRADFIGLATGPLHRAEAAGHPRHRAFAGHAFHTSRWDYAYTGGDPRAADGQAGRQAGRR
jgi:hypothetical protein